MRVIRGVLLLCLLTGHCAAQGLEFIKAHYTKYEYQIPMRDGKKLFTSVYLPKDTSQQYPIMLDRTPYNVGPYGVDNFKMTLGPSERFARDGFIFVYQDVRGRYMSEGEFVNMTPQLDVKRGPKDVDESSDTYDTIEWLIQHLPNHNGKVGMWGISYPGFYTAAGIIDAHPALKAASPQAPIADWFVGDDFHHNGALYLPHAFRFFSGFGHPRPTPTLPPANPPAPLSLADAYNFFLTLGPLTNVNEKFFKNDVPFWTEMMQHPTYDEFWQARDLRRHLKNIKPAVMTVGGWFDAEDLFGALNTYKEIEKSSPGANNTLVMGPWFHGGWSRSDGDSLGAVQFGSKTAVFYRDEIEFPFFDYWLKGKGDPKLPEAYVFETGTNQWRREDAWPPKNAQAKALYLQADGKLSFGAPKETGAAFDEYISDPAKPVPYIAGQSPQMTREHMVEDQRFASTRTDVLTYQTDELSGDVTISGPLTPSLFVSTTGTDSDWVVKLIDVYPEDYPNPDPNPLSLHMGGYQQLIRGEIFRGKFRNSFSKPEPFVPGKLEKIEYTMPDINHCFRKGHRIMVQIQSSWFPLADRNPQKFVDIYNAKASDFVKATQHVYRSASAASCVRLSVRQ
ncbi:MAG TPA: CocE/NonD family hydrolase [Bryobacteraceae bacterium]|nr:CocE/NonD family hydrolase [Bryobacteraceae bacterium]